MYMYIFNNAIIADQGMSGSDKRILYCTKLWKNKGLKINLFIPRQGINRFKNHGFNLIITDKNTKPVKKMLFTYAKRIITTLALIKKMPKLNVSDIIYSSSDLLPDAVPAIYLKKINPKTKFICGLHLMAQSMFPSYNRLSLKSVYYYLSQKYIISQLKNFADLVLVSNNIDAKKLKQLGFEDKQIIVAYPGVNFNLISKKETAKKYDAIWTGRLHPQKGINDLILIWSKIIEKIPNAKIAIAGEHNLEKYMQNSSYFNKIKKNVIFLGYLNDLQLFYHLKKAKIFLFPSHYESFSLAVLEAMACGLPVVAYNLPAFRLIWRKGLVLIPMDNYNKFAQAILNLLINKQKREKLAKEGQAFSQQFSWQKSANKILNLVK